MNLFPYQEEDVLQVKTILKEKKGVYLGHEMGLGKTIIALHSLGLSARHPNLILCPASVKGVWEAELERALISLNRIQVLNTTKDKLLPSLFVICSYDLAIRPPIGNQFLHKMWQYIICDECHCLGSLDSTRTRFVLGNLRNNAKHWMFLSGSVYRNEIIQLFPVFHFLAPTLFPDYWSFADKYCYVENGYWGKKVYGAKNLDKLKAKTKGFLIRREKKDVLEDLPPKIGQRVVLYLPLNEEQVIASARLDFENEIDKAFDKNGKAANQELSTIRRKLGMEKIPHVLLYVRELLTTLRENEEDPCLVVYCYHRTVWQTLWDELKKDPGGVCGLSGESDSTERKFAVAAFQDKRADIFLGTYAAAEGITLTRANIVVFAEQSWSLAQNEQALDRLHRIGQKKTVYAKYLVAKGTIDEVVYKTYKQKACIKNKLWREAP